MKDNTQRVWRMAALLGFLTFVAFWPAFENGFVEYDDQDYVTQNARVQEGLTRSGVQWAFATGHAANWHPLTWISHMLDVSMHGMDAGGHHATSVAIHITSVVLLFLFLVRTTGQLWPAALAAGLFGFHPLRVESVAWISERKDVLSGLFFMLTLLAYARYAEGAVDGGRKTVTSHQSPVIGGPWSIVSKEAWRWYALALVCFALGLMSKPMLVTVPFVLLLLDYWPLERLEFKSGFPGSRRIKQLVVEKLPFFLLTGISSFVTFSVQQTGGAVATMTRFPPDLRLENALVSYPRYLLKMLWPVDLSPFYPYPKEWLIPVVVFSALALLVLAGLVVANLRQRPFLATGVLWFLGMLVPVIGLVQVGSQSIADRYTYLPAIGLTIALVWLADQLIGHSPGARKMAAVAAALMMLGCAALTFRQTGYWRDTWTLFSHAREVTTNNEVAEYSLGAELVRLGKVEEAVPYFEAAVRIRPDYGEAQNNLGTALMLGGRLEEAVGHFQAAQKAGLNIPELHFNLAATLDRLGKREAGVAEYETALRMNPSFQEARFELAMLHLRSRQIDAAKSQFVTFARNDPRNPKGPLGLALTQVQEGSYSNSFSSFQAALELDPANPQVHYEYAKALEQSYVLQPTPELAFNLGLVRLVQKQSKEAVALFESALQSRPDWPIALNEIAWLLATSPDENARNGQKAVEMAEKAVASTGRKEARFLGTLDAAYAEAGRFEDAIRTAIEARTVAERAGEAGISAAAEDRLRSYQAGKPYRQP